MMNGCINHHQYLNNNILAANLNLTLSIEAWSDILIKIWRNKITELDIGNSGELFDSFTATVISNSGGSPARVDFAFNYYGRFVDMGVGSGVYVGNPGDVQTKRRPKRWYSSTFISQTIKLREILAEKYGKIGASVISETIRQGEGNNPIHSHKPNPKLSFGSQNTLSELDKVWMKRNGLL